jgi:hypothetical protein
VLLDPQDSLICPPFKRNFKFGIGEMALTSEVEVLGKIPVPNSKRIKSFSVMNKNQLTMIKNKIAVISESCVIARHILSGENEDIVIIELYAITDIGLSLFMGIFSMQ